MRLAQFEDGRGARGISADLGDGHRRVAGWGTVYDLAAEAIAEGRSLAELVAEQLTTERVDLDDLEPEGRLLPPLDHPGDPAHMLVTGTGLSHLGSAEGRDKMHRDLAEAATLTDSMRMFKLGLEGGKPGAGQEGVQPEWFYKGDGRDRGRARQAAREPVLRARRRRGARDRRPLPDRPRRHALARRLRARQRVLRPRHREAELPLSRPFQAADVQPRPGAAAGRRCPPTSAAPRASAADGAWCGRSRSCRARPTCATRSRTSSATTSSTRCSAAPATSTRTSSAPRR